MKSLVSRIKGPDGKDIPDALVQVVCTEDSSAVRNWLAVTDKSGLTPKGVENDAILVITKKLQATDNPEKPKKFSYTYKIIVQAAGHIKKEVILKTDQAIPKEYLITLKK